MRTRRGLAMAWMGAFCLPAPSGKWFSSFLACSPARRGSPAAPGGADPLRALERQEQVESCAQRDASTHKGERRCACALRSASGVGANSAWNVRPGEEGGEFTGTPSGSVAPLPAEGNHPARAAAFGFLPAGRLPQTNASERAE